MKHCRGCCEEVKDDDMYCEDCGQDVLGLKDKVERRNSDRRAVFPEAKLMAVRSGMGLCPLCGVESEGRVFCHACEYIAFNVILKESKKHGRS